MHTRQTLTQPLRLPLTLTTCLLLLSQMTSTGWTQTTCPEPDRCMSRERVLAVVDAACHRARAVEARMPTLVGDLATVQTQRDVCLGRLAQAQESPPEPWRSPLWLRLALDVGVGALAAGTGAVAGIGGPPEVVVGLAVGSVAALVARVVLELIDR